MTYNEDDKELREIELSDFWISKYKTTYAEFNVYSDDIGKERNGMGFPQHRTPLFPVGALDAGSDS